MQRNKQLFGMLTVAATVGCARGEELGRPAGALDAPRLVEHTDGIEGRYVVVLREKDGTMSTEDMHALATEHRGALLDTMGSRAAFSAALAAEDALELSKDPRVMFVEREALFHTVATQVDPTWGLDRIDQATLPLDAGYTYDGDGAGTTVYVIDTGVRATHVDFGGRASEGFTVVDDGNGAADCNGHGTHVSGTIAGATVGVAKGVSVVAVRALDCNGSGPTSGVIEAVNWVTANAQLPAVLNMSLGGPNSPALQQAVQQAIAAGITVVVAAGNDGADACGATPANVPSAITVAASDANDGFANFSNHGDCVDIVAPGVGIFSAWHTGDEAGNTIDGTSMAAPHVAGVAARLLALAPDLAPSDVADAIFGGATPDAIDGAPGDTQTRLLYSTLVPGGGDEGGGSDDGGGSEGGGESEDDGGNPGGDSEDDDGNPGDDEEEDDGNDDDEDVGGCTAACEAAVALCNGMSLPCDLLCEYGDADESCFADAGTCFDALDCL